MQTFLFIVINLFLVVVFVKLLKKKEFLTYLYNGKWWLTWLAVGIITLMDELTSIYYAPFEAYRFIGLKSIIYIALTSILIRFLSTRLVEIAEILEVNNIKGGGVYSVAYLVLGPNISFAAIASILVTYVITAAISTVSAVENGTSFLNVGEGVKFVLKFVIVWIITGLNIMGIKENAKFTFIIFIFAAFILTNLLISSIFNFGSDSINTVGKSFNFFIADFKGANIPNIYWNIITGIGSCILAYSGIESVLQTAGLVKNWKEIRKSFTFLALTVGIVTPLIALFALSGTSNLDAHETDLIPAFASQISGSFFGAAVSIMASITLIMALNTAMVASAELIEKVAERYTYTWLTKLNKSQALFRIHMINALFYTIIIIMTSGSQAVLAEMYAVGLIASFCIHTGSLLIYRYSKGTKQITYHTSRVGTLILFIILASTFIYIVIHRQYGTLLWLIITSSVIILGIRISKFRGPEIPVRRFTKTPMDIIFALLESESEKVHLYFRRPSELEAIEKNKDSIYVSFYTPRTEQPESRGENHFWLSIQRRMNLFDMVFGLLKTIEYELPPDKELHVHFGWPMSSWLDRLSIGVMIYNIIHLPKKFPSFTFHIDYKGFKKTS